MLSFFKKIFNCDEKASRIEFYIYVIFSIFLIVIPFMVMANTYNSYVNLLFVVCVIGFAAFLCVIFRRGKDRGMTNEQIINALAKMSLLLVAWALYLLVYDFLYHLFDLKIGQSFNTKSVYYVFPCLFVVYALVFLFSILFLGGAKQQSSEAEVNTFSQPTSKFPKIGEIFNRNFFSNIFNFKGRTRREEFWPYSILIMINLALFFYCFVLSNITVIDCFSYNPENGLPIEIFWIHWSVLGVGLLTLSLCCRRLRDLNIRPWKVVFLLIPPVNIFLFILMIFGKTETKQFTIHNVQ